MEEKLRGLHSHTAHRQKLKHLFKKDKRDYIVIWQLGQTSKGSSGARKLERSAFGYHEALLQVPAEKKAVKDKVEDLLTITEEQLER